VEKSNPMNFNPLSFIVQYNMTTKRVFFDLIYTI
jgi:hypothetical protein